MARPQLNSPLKIFDIRAGEGSRVGILHLQLILIIFAVALSRTIRDAVFVSRDGLSTLPWMYILHALLTPLAAAVYLRFLKQQHPWKIGFTVQLWLGVLFSTSAFLLFKDVVGAPQATYLMAEVFTVIAVTHFWNTANEEFHPTQAKRLYGFIASGQAIGNILCGVTVQVFEGILDSAGFLMIISIVVFLSGYLYKKTLPVSRPRHAPEPSADSDTEIKKVEQHYVRRLLLLAATTYVVISLVDFQFKVIASRTFGEAELIVFFGTFYGAIGVASLILQVFLFRRLTLVFSVFFLLTWMPLLFIGGGLWLITQPSIWSSSLLKFGDTGLRHGLHEPLSQTLYMPLRRAIRSRVQTVANGYAKPIGLALAGIVLILARPDQPGGIPAEWLGIGAGLLSMAIIAILMRHRTGYIRLLITESYEIAMQKVGTNRPSFIRESSFAEFIDIDGERSDMPPTPNISGSSLAHKARHLIESLDLHRFTYNQLITVTTPECLVAIAGVRTDRSSWKTLIPYLDTRDVDQVEAVLLALFLEKKVGATIEARNTLFVYAEGTRISDRVLAIRMLDFLPESDQKRIIKQALESPHPRIRVAAMRRIKSRPDETYIDAIAESLFDPSTRAFALLVLMDYGRQGWDAILKLDNEQPWRSLGHHWQEFVTASIQMEDELCAEIYEYVVSKESDPTFLYPIMSTIATMMPDHHHLLQRDIDAHVATMSYWVGVYQAVIALEHCHPLIVAAADQRRHDATRAVLISLVAGSDLLNDTFLTMVFTDFWEDHDTRSGLAGIVDHVAPTTYRRKIAELFDLQPVIEKKWEQAFSQLPFPIPFLVSTPADIQDSSTLYRQLADLSELVEIEDPEVIADVVTLCEYGNFDAGTDLSDTIKNPTVAHVLQRGTIEVKHKGQFHHRISARSHIDFHPTELRDDESDSLPVSVRAIDNVTWLSVKKDHARLFIAGLPEEQKQKLGQALLNETYAN